ncbi:MAG: carbamoyltransferase HypF [Planctomycetota bacterium]
MSTSVKRKRISIRGCVQGVGFRPAVYRVAKSVGLAGFVCNNSEGVTIELQGRENKIGEFLARLQSSDKPPLAEIESCKTVEVPLVADDDKFVIKTSDSRGSALSQVTPDMATCGDCLREMMEKSDFRYGYPFINCTNCGPRYSIVKNIPYDRSNTTMSQFAMCQRCAAQYSHVKDRRFHAQPVACSRCGPKVWITDSHTGTMKSRTDSSITEAARLLSSGRIVAIKGVGGFHLAVDALNNKAVLELRQRKKRDHKPFAMMAGSIERIKEYAHVSKAAEKILQSPQSPIVLLPKKENSPIAPAVADGVNTYAFMLCYAPLHHLLFAQNDIKVLVMTSGNISDEPLICKNDIAVERLGPVADAFLMHDREIYRQVDDSIIHFVDDQAVLLRRARGYVPAPILNKKSSREDIFAAGADLKNTFCLVKQNQFICSEHIGDLEDARVYHHYVNSIEHLRRLFEAEPAIAVCDLHPDYLSSQYVFSKFNRNNIIEVQHHWAHAASVMAEHGLEGPVIGLVADGTGYGTDGAIWGCECIISSLHDFQRFGCLDYFPLPGADRAGKEAVRPLLGLLKKSYGADFKLERFNWLLERIRSGSNRCYNFEIKDSKFILEQLEKRINTVETSSLGRVFDAVAAATGLGSYNYFDAQLPMALEAIIAPEIEDRYDFEITDSNGRLMQIDLGLMIKQLIIDIKDGLAAGIVSAKFHNCLAEALLEMAKKARETKGLNMAALSGGVFCNRYLADRLTKLLKKNDFCVLFNQRVPSNDGGISLGQAAIAVNLINHKK